MENEDKGFEEFLSNILFVIVLYKFELYNSRSFTSLMDTLKPFNANLTFFIYDNSPEPLLQLKETEAEIHYINNPKNPGVGKAYNEASDYAHLNNKKWLFVADQDTVFSHGLFPLFYKAINTTPGIELYVPMLKQNNVLLSPCRFKHYVGSGLKDINPGIHSFENKTVLNSGMFVTNESFVKAGGFNEKIKLDFADFAFINKYKKLYPQFMLVDSICLHELSSFESDAEKTKTRFRIYCHDARKYANSLAAFLSVGFFVSLRTIKLTYIFRRLSFFRIFITEFLFQSSI